MESDLQSGFIALVSTIIISGVLMMLVFSSSTSSFFARFDIQNGEFRKMSLNLSESCVNVALLKIAQNYNYLPPVGGETVSVAENYCKIQSVIYETEDLLTHKKLATITTSAHFPDINGSYSTSKVLISVQNPLYLPINSEAVLIKSWYDI